MESELFGFEKGAFTGAEKQRRGRFELANKGTLFLDEIGDMSPSAQAKILRALEYKEFERLGGESIVRVDTRVIAATNRHLSLLIKEGKFRRDLFYRINEITIEVPPLRERKGDIPILIELFIKEYNEETGKSIKGCSDSTMPALVGYHWPGNVRELKSVIRRAAALTDRDILWQEDLGISYEIDIETRYYRQDDLSLKTFERKHIEKVLRIAAWNKTRACNLLGLSRPTLDKKIKEYGIKEK
jgi:transcriptional regulator with PAS, ATPase and Fis domain